MYIEVYKNLPDKKALKEIVGKGNFSYLHEIKSYAIKKRGFIWKKNDKNSHKWKENGKTYDFCLKCGCTRETEKYWSHGCPISSRQYNGSVYPEHKYELFKIKKPNSMRWINGRYVVSSEEKIYEIMACSKCGLIKSRENIYYRVHKDTNLHYEVNSPVGSKKKKIYCSFTDDEYEIKDILT